MSFKFAKIENGELDTHEFYSYEHLKDHLEKDLEKFKRINNVTKDSDIYYMQKKRQMEQTLEKYNDHVKVPSFNFDAYKT
jgi:hypothetical protein